MTFLKLLEQELLAALPEHTKEALDKIDKDHTIEGLEGTVYEFVAEYLNAQFYHWTGTAFDTAKTYDHLRNVSILLDCMEQAGDRLKITPESLHQSASFGNNYSFHGLLCTEVSWAERAVKNLNTILDLDVDLNRLKFLIRQYEAAKAIEVDEAQHAKFAEYVTKRRSQTDILLLFDWPGKSNGYSKFLKLFEDLEYSKLTAYNKSVASLYENSTIKKSFE